VVTGLFIVVIVLVLESSIQSKIAFAAQAAPGSQVTSLATNPHPLYYIQKFCVDKIPLKKFSFFDIINIEKILNFIFLYGRFK
jgi:hypothetical protein